LSITRLALPIERSMVLIGTSFTSAETPMWWSANADSI
jgi:hypothetical protein